MFCNKCGNAIANDEVFCGKCGNKTEQVPPPQTFCNKCGNALADGEVFCGKCGNKNEQSQAGEHESFVSKSLFNIFKGCDIKKYTKPAIAVLAALCGISAALILFMMLSTNYEQRKGSILFFSDDSSVAIIPNGGAKIEIDGQLSNSTSSFDGKKAVALVEEADKRASEGNLYLITDKAQKISDDVIAFQFAASGNAVLYVKGHDSSNNIAELWIYSNGKPTKLTSDLYVGHNSLFAISPDGKTVVYATNKDDKISGIVWNGSEQEIGRDMIPFAVADDAKYIYYTKDGSSFVQKGLSGSRERLGEISTPFYLNKDLSQIVYNSDSKAYISNKGQAREPLTETIYNFIVPVGTALSNDLLSGAYVIYGISDFSNTFYMSGASSLVRINAKYETERIARDVTQAYIAQDGKTLLYLRNERLNKIDGIKTNSDNNQIGDEKVSNFIAAANGGAVYYVDNNNDLYYQKGTAEAVSVEHSVRNPSLLMFKGNMLFYNSNRELYTSDGTRGKLVRGIDDDVNYAYIVFGGKAGNTICVVTDDGTYYSNDGIKFESVFK